MKKINFMFAILVMASMTFVSSCSKDTTPPTIQFLGGTGYTSSDVTVTVNTPVKVGVTAQSGSSKLVNLTITATSNNVPETLLDSTFSSDTFNKDYTITAPTVVGTVRLSFKITDKDGQTAEVAFNLTTTAGSGPITSYNQKILGSYDNTAYGSSFASADGSVYTMSQALANAAKIDWMYFYGSSTNLATFVAPSNADAASVFSNATNGVSKWSVRNDTKLAKVTLPTGVTWDNITTDAEIIPLATGITDTKTNLLAVNQIVAFKTVTGKMGLIKVETITGTTAGSITYSVKVQN